MDFTTYRLNATPRNKRIKNYFSTIEGNVTYNYGGSLSSGGSSSGGGTSSPIKVQINGTGNAISNAEVDINNQLIFTKDATFPTLTDFNALNSTVTSHTGNTTVHVTQSDKNRWNNNIVQQNLYTISVPQTANTINYNVGDYPHLASIVIDCSVQDIIINVTASTTDMGKVQFVTFLNRTMRLSTITVNNVVGTTTFQLDAMKAMNFNVSTSVNIYLSDSTIRVVWD